MITAIYEPHLFPRDRSPPGLLGTPHRGCIPQSTENDDIDRFMELAHAALEEATKEEDAKGVLRELLERFLAKTGAPLMADVISEQLRSQEIIEQLAEQSFERQRGRYEQQQQQQQQQVSPTSSVTTGQKKRLNNTLLSRNEKTHKYSPAQRRQTTSKSTPLPSQYSLSSSILSSAAAEETSLSPNHKDSIDHETMDEAVTRDQFIIQHSPSLHTGPDRLLLVSEYIWRLFRLLILATSVALVYHYVCTHPYQLFLAF